MLLLQSKTVYITGDTGRLGRQLVNLFLGENYRVVGISRRESAKDSEKYTHIAKDINLADEVWFSELFANRGAPDIFVNNAGAFEEKEIENTTDRLAQDIFNTNFFAPVKITRVLFKYYKKEGLLKNILRNRCIINVGSAAYLPSIVNSDERPISIYAASKAALVLFSQASSKESLPLGVRVNTLAPRYFSNSEALTVKIAQIGMRLARGRENGVIAYE